MNQTAYQAKDNGNENDWSMNYWSDHNETDSNNDNFLDKPYLILGEGYAKDCCPLSARIFVPLNTNCPLTTSDDFSNSKSTNSPGLGLEILLVIGLIYLDRKLRKAKVKL